MKPRGLGGLRCWGHNGARKKQYATKKVAESAANSGQKAYHCTDCGQWHITTKH